MAGGPKVNVQRCEEILAQGKARGIEPSPDAVERFVATMPVGSSGADA